MNNKFFIALVILVLFVSCKQETHLTRIEGKRLDINDSISSIQEIEDFIKPFRDRVNKDMDSVLGYSMDNYSKTNGDLNTAVGNFMADAVMEMSNPIYKSRTGNDIDMVLLNHGGIRSTLYKGDITTRTAYQLMPFDNEVIVVEMNGKIVREMINYLQKAKRAHPISGLKITLDSEYNLIESKINGEPVNDSTIYHIATNDFLYDGGDRMTFLKNGNQMQSLDYKIRNLLIDYFKKHDTLSPTIDDRFIINK